MDGREDYLYWRLAYHFLSDDRYRLRTISELKNEIWLESQMGGQPNIIRLVRYDIDWANRVKQDYQFTLARADKLRKQLFKRELHILTIYVTAYRPVDDLDLPVSSGKEKVTIQSVLLSRDEYESAIHEISEATGKIPDWQLADEYAETEIYELEQGVLQKASSQIEADRQLFEFGKPFFTYFLIAIQLVIFVLLEFKGGSTNTETLIQFGAKFNPLILQGEWWRFITPVFLHIGVIHLLMNTLALYYLGTMVEKMFGRSRFLWIYLLSGFAGAAASFALNDNLSAGASGAIFGCFGALLYVGTIYPKLFFRTIGINVIVLVGINLVFGFTMPGIDNAGHIGGLIGGFLATGAVGFPRKKKTFRSMISFLGLLVFLSGLLFYGYQAERPATINVLAQQHIENEDVQEAYDLLSEYTKKGKGDDVTYFYLSYAEIQLNKIEDAKQHLLKVIGMNNGFHEAYHNLALIYLGEGDEEQALEYARRAAKLSDDEKYQELVERLEKTEENVR